ncbi:bifunctional 2-polyprenyl-6-hydroxyphenol methylase/3-demethylubiquinol 3-O-methyltransferase UbiG [Gammaproteobacteria bacterium]|nr:bifunctional 2-polyprenyl-6-hydroxyphenol methylase/3-demethylubiquinol 3-O-methyltransferase UbiG [Gammaproteobacteria bacterium]
MDKKELNQESHFDEFAYDWWNKSGHYKLLHALNPIRLEYILSRCSLDKKNVLDIGCGGGILSEELCKQGAKVTGIDSSSKSISIAKQHAKQNNYDIKYINKSIFEITDLGIYDFIICFEMIEHINEPNDLIKKIKELSSKKSGLFLSTINRNLKSFMLAKIMAEYVLNYVPKGTHQYAKFITPYELTKMLENNNYKLNDISGLNFNPLDESFHLSSDTDINYFLYAEK